MASSSGSGVSSGSTPPVANSGSEDLRQVMDQRKQRRMLSNRESARRSRMRKQKHLDDLTAQVARLRHENNQIISNYKAIMQRHLAVESDNSVLRSQVAALSNRLESLSEAIQYMNRATNSGTLRELPHQAIDGFPVHPWNLLSVNQPIMASPDMLQC
ncbi:unnamed protein product [Spirodela intermedia]|uniref:BZIP domain-containing protein n=1 Tax=Spirodela intermedia TaxID=51605 RepID=A0A7I8LLX8_SPIIN|nr:unnamed protein product [Spirodela intermedia]